MSDAAFEDFTQEACVRVLDSLHTFRGESSFLAWALAIAVRIALTEMRRASFRNVSLEAMSEAGAHFEVVSNDVSAEQLAIRQQIQGTLEGLIATTLSARQRAALQAEIGGVPLSEIALRMEMNRGALYKLLHDARLRLKAGLEARGFGPLEIWAAWPS